MLLLQLTSHISLTIERLSINLVKLSLSLTQKLIM